VTQKVSKDILLPDDVSQEKTELPSCIFEKKVPHATVVKTRCQSTETLSENEKSKKNWFETVGLELFDVLSEAKVKTSVFDVEFFKDQQNERQKKIAKSVSHDFICEKKNEEVEAKRKNRRIELAYGINQPSENFEMDTDEPQSDDKFADVALDQYMTQTQTTTGVFLN
jgi:hypothetical protein